MLWSPSGLSTVPHLQWGSHLAHFFGSGAELPEVLVPFFKAGLENNERCLWVTGQAFSAEQARSALRAAVPDLDKRERGKQIEIANADEWYSSGQKLRPHDLVSALVQREQVSLGLGYAGLRTSGNCAWVSQEQWEDFLEYEGLVQRAGRDRRMISICSYCVDQLRDGAHLEVMERHDLSLSTRPRNSTASPRQRAARSEASDGISFSRRGRLPNVERRSEFRDLPYRSSAKCKNATRPTDVPLITAAATMFFFVFVTA